MAKVCKYYIDHKFLSEDCGETWLDTGDSMKGDLYEPNSTDCGFELMYRWALSQGDYECDSVRKYNVDVLQFSTRFDDDYENVEPEYKRRGDIDDYLSEDCGYVESTGGFKFSGATVINCGESYYNYGTEYLSRNEIVNYITPHSIVGDCTEVIGEGAFSGSVVTQIDISSYVKEIESRAFYICSGLTNVTIPNSAEKIGYDVFSHCINLSGVTLPSGLTYISPGMFSDTNITNIVLPNTIRLIGSGAFESPTSGTPLNISLPQTLTDLAGFVFYNRTLPSGFTLPNSIKYLTCEIPDGLEFPPYLEHIGDDGGYGSSNEYYNVTSVPGSVKLLTVYAGINSGATLSEGIECIAGGWSGEDLPNSVNFVFSGGFHKFECGIRISIGAVKTAYGEYIYPPNAQVVGDAPYGSLGSTADVIVTFKSAIPPIHSISQHTRYIFVPDASVELYKAMWSGYKQYIYPLSYKQYEWRQMSIEDGYECVGVDKHYRERQFISFDSGQTWNDTCVTRAGALYEANSVDCGYIPQSYTLALTYNDGKIDSVTACETTTVPVNSGDSTIDTVSIGDCARTIPANCFKSCSVTSVDILNGITSISSDAFAQCDSLTSVTIASGITDIGYEAFFRCRSLRNVDIPNSVTNIDGRAFSDCNSLSSITIPNGVTSINNGVFRHCTSLTSISIPNGVTSIGESAFNECTSLTSVTIPSGVTSIGDYTFKSCYDLSSITVNAVTPPVLGGGSVFSGTNCPIYVPSQSLSAYQSASIWSNYASRLQAIP